MVGKDVTDKLPKPLLWRYAIAAALTLAFQIWVRSNLCVGITACGISFAKGVVWSMIWPLYWIIYVVGMP
jgi:hypothetical protein